MEEEEREREGEWEEIKKFFWLGWSRFCLAEVEEKGEQGMDIFSWL